MAKKSSSRTKSTGGKDLVKCIRAIKNKQTGAYGFEEKMVHKTNVRKYFEHD